MSALQLVAIGVALGTLALIPAAIYWWRHPPRSTAGRVVYWACFAPVLGLGAFAMGVLALEELRGGRVGLGTESHGAPPALPAGGFGSCPSP